MKTEDLVIKVLYIVRTEDLGKIGCNLPKRTVV